jgi:hypothetical protein
MIQSLFAYCKRWFYEYQLKERIFDFTLMELFVIVLIVVLIWSWIWELIIM